MSDQGEGMYLCDDIITLSDNIAGLEFAWKIYQDSEDFAFEGLRFYTNLVIVVF